MIAIPGYQVIESLHVGTDVEVYRAQRERDSLPVVLKVLQQDYPSAAKLERYRHEFATLERLDLPCVLPVYDLLECGNGLAIAMADCRGISLKQVLAQQGALPVAEALDVAIAIAAGLADLHAARIIHKDLNPANILLANGDFRDIRIIDFGLADQLLAASTRRQVERLEGTLAYLSPEQTGRVARPLDSRTDIYAFGVTLYYMLAGQLPFVAADDIAWVHAHLAKQPVPLEQANPAVPVMLGQIAAKLMAKTADDRYQTAAGVQADLVACRTQWKQSGRIEPFGLAQHDRSDRVVLPSKLYGRDRELARLRAAFERAALGRHSSIWIAGGAGVGKSSLIRALPATIAPRACLRVTGKFDQYRRDLPYAALVMALQDLVYQLLGRSDAELSDWRDRLHEAVAENSGVLVERVPELDSLLPNAVVPLALAPERGRHRLHMAVGAFLEAVASADCPLVMVWDDVQWADPASLDLLRYLAISLGDRPFLTICAYRPEEEVGSRELAALREELEGASSAAVEHIELTGLNADEFQHWLSDALATTPEQCQALSDIVLAKTGGNPLFAGEFLRSLHARNWLHFDVEQERWQWNLAAIADLDATENVVELLAARIDRLSPQAQSSLALAACVGNEFELPVLATLRARAPDRQMGELREAIDAGLIFPIQAQMASSDRYKFAHDRVQQAAYAHLSSDERASVHWQIGQWQWQRWRNRFEAAPIEATPINADESDTRQTRAGEANSRTGDRELFDAVNHLGLGVSAAGEGIDTEALARLHLQAGRRAKAVAAYDLAATYLEAGLQILSQAVGTLERCWQDCYELTLQLHVEAAEAAYLRADFAKMTTRANAARTHARSHLDTLALDEIDILTWVARGQPLQAVDTGLRVLQRLHEPLPKRPSRSRVLLEWLRFWAARIRLESLAQSPPMRDREKLAVLRIISLIGSPAYHAVPTLVPLLAWRSVYLTARFGATPESCYSFAVCGTIFCSIIGDIATGYRFGQLALQAAESPQARALQPRTLMAVNTFIRHWQDPLRAGLPQLQAACEVGLATGDLEFATYAAFVESYQAYFAGCELDPLQRAIASRLTLSRHLKQHTAIAFLHIYSYALERLLSAGDATSARDAKSAGTSLAERERQLLHDLTAAGNRSGLFHYHCNQGIAAFLFGCPDTAHTHMQQAEAYIDGVRASYIVPIFHFYDSLIRLAQFETAPARQQQRILQRVRRTQRQFERWAKFSPVNHQHKLDLVEAEWVRVQDRPAEARHHYQRAIALAREHQFLSERALASELAAKFELDRKHLQAARHHFDDARYGFERWGAWAKVRQLDERYPPFAPASSPATPATSPTPATSSTISTSSITRTVAFEPRSLDISTMLKASQALSGELVLDRLIAKLLDIAIENAGAKRGLLVLERNGELSVAAEATVDGAATSALPVSQSNSLPKSVVYLVSRTRADVVVADATQHEQFASDPYVLESGARSLMCLPIVNQGRFLGLLYLENKDVVGAFTSQRLELLRVLAAQAAISLDNASMYDNLGQLVEERTQELETKNAELAERNLALERARRESDAANRAKSQFLAVMSHEIRTPMNAIIGLTNLLLDSSLSDEQREFSEIVRDSSESLLSLLDDILDYSKIESQRLELEQHPFDLRQCVRDAMSVLAPQARTKGIGLRSEISPSVPMQVAGDVMRLRQILLNLIGNAVKFSDCGEILVSVAARKAREFATETPSGEASSARHLSSRSGTTPPILLEFSVRDRGIGIPAHRLDALFESFSQVDASTTRRYGGTGLGLAICKRLSELMGGTIWAESELGRGSTFYFTIAAAQVVPEAASLATEDVPLISSELITSDRLTASPLTSSDPPPSPRILIVEDNAVNQKVALKLLERLGYEADIAANGVEAIAAIQQCRYDLAFMDVQMPEMDGLEATRRIRQDFPADQQPRIVAMTANAMKGDREICLAAGMDDYISKPVRPDDLRRVMHHPSATSAPMSDPASAEIDSQTLNTLRDAVGGDDADSFVAELIGDYLADAPNYIAAIQAAIAAGDVEQFRQNAHTLKSTSGTIGALEFANVCLELEKQGRAGRLPENDRALVPLLQGYERVRTALLALLPSTKHAESGDAAS